MKTSSDGGPTLDKATARACLFTNLLVLPGLGSLAAGRRVGYAQAALALLGFAGTFGWLLLFGREWVERGELPLEFNGVLALGVGGAALFGAAWLWALGTSLRIRREARESAPPKPPPLDRPPAPPVLPPTDS
jgi:hypothetical protein